MSPPLDAMRAARALDDSLVLANVSRRRFVQRSAALGAFVLAAGLVPRARAADAEKFGADGMPHGWVDNPLVFVSVSEDGTVSIVCHRSEMGQGVRTGMPMIVADELEADWSKVRVVQAPGDEERYGNQDTDGSRSTRHFFMPMRRCGAAARQMLEAAAAAQWKVPVSEVQAKNGEVIHAKSSRKLGYGALAKAAATMPVPAMGEIKLKDPAQFRYIGSDKIKLLDAPDITTGKAQYAQDTRLPGMVYAVVARPEVYGGKVTSFDASDAMKVPGVIKVVAIDGSPPPPQFNPLGGVAVIRATRGRRCRAARRSRSFGTTVRTLATTRTSTRRHCRRPRASPARSCARMAISRRRTRARPRRWKRSITSRTSRMRRWSRLRRALALRRASAKCGAASSRRRPRVIWSPSASASPSKTSRCT